MTAVLPATRAATAAVALAQVESARQMRAEELRAELTALDPVAFAAYLGERRMLPLIGTRAVELLGDTCSPDLRSHVAAAVRAAGVRAMVHEHALAAATGALERAGIPALPLKGIVLARHAHGDTALREASDTDVLVADRDLDRAIEVLLNIGYERPHDPPWVRGRPLLHYTLHHRDRLIPPLELHWRIHWSELQFSEALLARSTRVGADREAQPVDELSSLLLFYARDGFAGLRLAADIAAWWDRNAPLVPENALESYLHEHPPLRRSFEAALCVLEATVGLPAHRLVRVSAPDRSARRAAALADPWLTAAPARITARIMAVDWLLSRGPAKLGFLRRYVIHPQAQVRLTYGMESRSAAIVAGRSFVHAVGTVVKGGPRVTREILGA